MPASEPVPGTRRCRILLVEDSDIDAELIGIHLARAGLDYELRRARNRAEFIRLVALDGVDLVLSDYSLPDIDGLKALELARERLPDVPFVFISGVGGEEPATDALRRGATDYVLKRNLARLPASISRALSEAEERSRRREAESALVKSEANMRLALDAATLGLWQFFDDGTIGWDDACSAMLGVDDGLGRSERAPYQRLLERVHADDRVDFDTTVHLALAVDSAAGLAHECRFVTADGEVRWILLRGRRLGAAGDGGVRMTGVMQDLTSTRSLESSQRRAEVLFRITAQATGLGLWEIGPEPDRIWVDESYRRLVGLDRAGVEDLKLLIAAVVHSDDLAAVEAAIGAAYAGRTDEIEIEHRLIRPTDDGVGWLAARGRRIVGADGAYRLVGTVRDVTEARRQQRALVASNEELERRVAARTRELTSEIAERNRVEDTLLHMQRLEAVGQLTSGVAHDFNNLLTVVLSNVTLVGKLLAQQPGTDERIAKRLDSIRDAAKRGATLTRQLLAFSRRQRLAPQAVNFNEVVRGMRDLLHTTLGGSVNLVTELADDVWTALVDPTQMELIILNLAINARDAMEVGGSLLVRTANATLDTAPARPEEPEPGDYVVVGVSDTGTGMSDAVLAKAFEPFFTTKDVGKGSGLGLAQVFGFAKQSGGGVRIETELGRGTTVSVYMPRAHAAAVGTPAERPAAGVEPLSATSAAGRCVLVVDDDLAVREATAAVLATHGYRVEEAGEAASAIDRLREPERIDLALVDFAMPLMNGAELAIIARQLRPGLPIVFLTGYADLGLLEAGQERFVLQKPIEESELVARIGEALQAAEGARD